MKQEIALLRKRILSDKRCHADAPVYIFDQQALCDSVDDFMESFASANLSVQPFYAMKSNPYPALLATLNRKGIGVDVSSEQELSIAVKAKVRRIMVTGPGKTEAFFRALSRVPAVEVIYLESLQELSNFKKVFKRVPTHCKIGVRVVPSAYAAWDKFGIALSELGSFIRAANRQHTPIEAIQFHISYVKDARTHAAALTELAEFSASHLRATERNQITIIDIGGGFMPQTMEGDYPWNPKGYSLFDIDSIKEKILNLPPRKRATFSKPASLTQTAKQVALVWRNKILPCFPSAELFAEPGRYFSHRSMHILLKVVDKKHRRAAILNGGWNMLGWEKYQYLSYVPAYNIDHFSLSKEQPCVLYGNLCLPDDIWGYYVHGTKLTIGDRILLPYQGAYTYTYRQEFIRGIPHVIDWKGERR